MSGNRGPLDEDGITDTEVLTDTRVADAGPVTSTARKSAPKLLTLQQASATARSLARNWLQRIDSTMKNVELLGWESPELSTFVSKKPAKPDDAYSAWTNSPVLIFINYELAPRRPDHMDVWLIAVLRHEAFHIEWFKGDPTETPPRPKGHPQTFLLGLEHEKNTYQRTARWLEGGDATKLFETHVQKPIPVAARNEIKRIAAQQRAGCRGLEAALKQVMTLPSAAREDAAFAMFGFSSALSQDLKTAMKQLYNEP